MQWATAVGLEKTLHIENREQTDREQTDRETNERGHSITVPMEHWVERGNIQRNQLQSPL